MATLASTQSRAILPYLYYELSQQQDGWVSSLSGPVISSDQGTETYAGLGSIARMREARGNRVANTLRAESYALTNREYEGTLLVTGKERRRDKTGQVMRRISDLRTTYQQHWMELGAEMLLRGEATAAPYLAYDDQSFFDTDHVSGASGTQSNDIGASATVTTAPTPAEAETAIWAAITQLMVLKDDQGRPMNRGANSFTVLFPPSMSRGMVGAIAAEYIAESSAGVSNVLRNSGYTFNLVPLADLQVGIAGVTAWTAKFAVVVNDGRAFIRQEEVPLQITAKAEGSDFEHDNLGDHEYGVFTSRACGFGSWQSACLVTLS
jgi:phage major head subunit gpT-like protein